MCECALHLWTKVPEVLGRFESRYMGCGGNSATSGNNPGASHFFYTFHHSIIPSFQSCQKHTRKTDMPGNLSGWITTFPSISDTKSWDQSLKFRQLVWGCPRF